MQPGPQIDSDPNLTMLDFGELKVAGYFTDMLKHYGGKVMPSTTTLPKPIGWQRESGVRADALGAAGTPLPHLAANVGLRSGAGIGAVVGGVGNTIYGKETNDEGEHISAPERFLTGALPGMAAGGALGWGLRRHWDRVAAPHLPAAIERYNARPKG